MYLFVVFVVSCCYCLCVQYRGCCVVGSVLFVVFLVSCCYCLCAVQGLLHC